MKADRNFRMKQTTKRWAAGILDAHERGEYLRMMIHAQLIAARTPTRRDRTAKPEVESE
jgi:hypothetical protein